MWGDDPDRQEPTITSDIPDGSWSTNKRIGFGMLVLVVLLALVYWQYGDLLSTPPAPVRNPNLPPPVYAVATACGLTDNISCDMSTITGNELTLILTNWNDWDITEGSVAVTSLTGSCTFDGEQTLDLFPSQSTQVFNFTCADDTSYHNASFIHNDIKITYKRDGAPLTRYAMGSVNRTVSIVS